MMQTIIVLVLVIITIWLAISNSLLRIKNDIVTAEIWLVREKLADKEEGESLIKFMQNWRDEDARINNSVIGYDRNNSNTADVYTETMESDREAE